MMKAKIEDQEQFEAQIEQFKEKYIQELTTKLAVPDCDKAYVKERYKRDVLEGRLNEIFKSANVVEAHHYRNQMKWIKGIQPFGAIKEFCEEKQSNKDYQRILFSLAEYDAISVLYNEILENKLPAPETKIENLEEFIQKVQQKENTFCNAMPLKIPIEHFKAFVDQKNKAGRSYLPRSEFISFIKRVFLNDNSISKITLNYGNREKLFVIKRFYEFYQKGIEYENSTQCKDKYIKLVSENFTNWTYESLKNNFGNKVRRQW